MLTDFQKAKLIEWAEWREINPDDGVMPFGLNLVDDWICWQGLCTAPFPTAEQMTPTRADFGLE